MEEEGRRPQHRVWCIRGLWGLEGCFGVVAMTCFSLQRLGCLGCLERLEHSVAASSLLVQTPAGLFAEI